MELSRELQELLHDAEFAPLKEALAKANILTVDALRSIKLWPFLNQHDLYSIAGRFIINSRVRELLDDYTPPAPPLTEEPVATLEEESDPDLELPQPEAVPEVLPEVEASPESEPVDLSKVPYSVIYSRDPQLYQDMPTAECGFSVRVIGRLLKFDIVNVGKLLEVNDERLLSISGFGRNSLEEIHAFLGKLEERSPGELEADPYIELTDELYDYKEELWAGDFSFADEQKLSLDSMRKVLAFKEAHQVLDPDLIRAIHDDPEKANDIIAMFKQFREELSQISACEEAIKDIPVQRLRMDAKRIIMAFTSNKEFREVLMESYQEGDTLEKYILANAAAVAGQALIITRLIKWCSYDVRAEIETHIAEATKKDRAQRVLYGRARGATLAELGDEMGVSRERIRQIEAKIQRVLLTRFSKSRIIQKIFLDLDETTALSSKAITEYVGKKGTEVVYLLKEFSESTSPYSYNPRFDMFWFEKEKRIERLQDQIDNLPELVPAEEMEQLIANTVESTGYADKLIRPMVLDSYQRTGDTYHRSRLSLTTMYKEVLRKYYPEGVHIDDEEMIRFRERVQDEYGIDISDRSVHAVSSIIGRVGVLCGRGRYLSRDYAVQLPKELVQSIQAYVEGRKLPITLFTSIFNEFQTELEALGVDNRYYLQGLLKDLFEDQWYFRKDYVSTDAEVTSFYETLASFIAEATSPVSREEIQRQFPGITDIVINMSLDNPDILNLFGSYIHVSRLKLTDGDIQYLHQKVEEALSDEDELCYVRDLYPVIVQEKPGLLSRNFVTSGFCLYSLLEHLFGEEYNFQRPFIAREGAEIKSILSVLKEMVTESETIAISEVLSFASEHHYSIASILDFVELCNGTHLMTNADELASIEHIGATEETARALEALILEEITEATPIQHLQCVHEFPKLNVEWNAWLVYSILKKWSKALDVGISKLVFKISYPVVAPAGMSLTVPDDPSISHDGELIMPDNLDNIEELIADYLVDELGGSDEI